MRDQETKRAHLGTWIKVKGLTPENEAFEDAFHLVPDREADRAEHNIAMNSLLGQALSGTMVGDEVILDTKGGPMKLTVLKLGPNRGDIQ